MEENGKEIGGRGLGAGGRGLHRSAVSIGGRRGSEWAMTPLSCVVLGALLAAAAPPEVEEGEEECTDGYEWDPETEHCKDIDECSVPPPPCRGSMRCLNHYGGFLCLPRSAALIRGPPPPPQLTPPHSLTPSHSLTPPHSAPSHSLTPPHSHAPPPPHSYSPPLHYAPPTDGRCPSGYSPAPDGTCQDVDECEGPPPCRPSQECINQPGGFECRCPPGYRHLNTECVDVDECQHRLCQHSCSNSPGSFSCRCQPGFRLGPNNRSCLDVNECSLGARCSHLCLNTFGSFWCRCRPGFTLSPDGLNCDDVDECLGGGARCQHRCENLPGGFKCHCPPGYQATRGGQCIDVDECHSGTHTCGSERGCINTFGGHRCVQEPLCSAPYRTDNRTHGSCVCPPGVPSCSPLPPRLLFRFLAVPSLPHPPVPLYQFRRPPGPSRRLKLNGGPAGMFRLRDLSNESSLLELLRPITGPREVELEVELLPGAGPVVATPTSPSRPMAALRLTVIVGQWTF